MNKRTKAQYIRLYDDPTTLFPNVETTLFPNGAPEIWFKTADGLGVKVKASNGPAGLSVNVERFTLTPAVTHGVRNTGTLSRYICEAGDDAAITQYRSDPYAEAFQSWYWEGDEYPGTREEFEAKRCAIK